MTRYLALTALLLAACDGNKDTDDVPLDDTAPIASWNILGDESTLPAAAVLALWGSSATDVWMVGADDGTGPLLMHYDGSAWARLDTGTTGDLWWIWGDGAGTIMMAGAAGRVVVHDVAGGTFVEEQAADPGVTLFGLWGMSTSDVWAVGGDVNGVLDGVMAHYDGVAWTTIDTAPQNGVSTRASFKVWGRATDDVYVVGTQALVTHWDGTVFTQVVPEPVYITTQLTTVHGDADQVVAVGGFGNAVVARNDGSGWVEDSPPPASIAPAFNGVFVGASLTVGCGIDGGVWARDAASGWAEHTRLDTQSDLHACWIDPDGHIWTVGGDLTTLGAGYVATDAADVPSISL